MPKGTVYLIHFDTKYKHAGHYIGFTAKDSPLARLAQHRNGQGARLLAVLNEAKIGYHVARIWRDSTRTFERELKDRKNAAKLCPFCNPATKRKRYRLHKK